ncbi:MAG: hypothetical protein PHQ64_03835 [Bacilli bacterium]|nr:hypothetical protein [Bacilli bacterium]
MEILKSNSEINIKDDDKLLISLKFIADEFVCLFYSEEPIIIDSELDGTFYEGIKEIMDSNYQFFDNDLSVKSKDKLVWLSDQYGDLDDINCTNKISRLVIEKDGDKFIINSYRPDFINYNIIRRPLVNVFSPAGNGKYAINLKTGSTLQDDMVLNLYVPLIDIAKVKKNKGVVKNMKKKI